MLIWGFFVVGEELMLLGLISLLLGQWARWISEICVDSSLFSSRFYPCSEDDFSVEDISGTGLFPSNQTGPQKTSSASLSHGCSEVRYASNCFCFTMYDSELGFDGKCML